MRGDQGSYKVKKRGLLERQAGRCHARAAAVRLAHLRHDGKELGAIENLMGWNKMVCASHPFAEFISLPLACHISGLDSLSAATLVITTTNNNPIRTERKLISVLILPLAWTPSLSRLRHCTSIKSRETATWNADTETRGNGGGDTG